MHRIKLTLAYDGTAYDGWQVQPDRATLQGVLEEAIRQVTGESSRTLASGRTDAGVHALAQVASFRTDCQLPPEVLLRALNARLPHDIAVLDVAVAADDFHPIRDARRKRYRYVIHDGPVRDVFNRHYTWYVKGPLDDAAMARAARTLVGRHDFSSFENAGAPRQDSIRTVSDIRVVRLPVNAIMPAAGPVDLLHEQPQEQGRAGRADSAEQDKAEQSRAGQGSSAQHKAEQGGLSPFIAIEVEADGFLYNMVRNIVGTLVEVGRGAEDETYPARALMAKDRSHAGPTAPPQGLFLVNVHYY